MRARTKRRSNVPEPVKAPGVAPAWLRPVILVLSGLLLIALFSTEVSDPDTWWHLKTGQYILEQHKLPVPDPFAHTTYLGKPAYPGEQTTRYFNLTHEWLAQVLLYSSYAAGGFAGLVLMRSLWMAACCGLVGLIVYRRTQAFYRAVGASLVVSVILVRFATDRPQYLTFAFLALTIAVLESRRHLWILPPIFIVWANCHAGFFLGWVAVGIYCLASLILRWQGKPVAQERTLWLASVSSVLASGLNPNWFKVIPVLFYYRGSAMQSQIWEWQTPLFWDISPFSVLLFGSLAVLLWYRRQVRPSDWLLLLLFGAAALMAIRNITLIGIVGPILIVTYLPSRNDKPRTEDWILIAALAAAILVVVYKLLPFHPVAVLTIGPLAVWVIYLLWTGKVPRIAEATVAVLLLASAGYLAATGQGLRFGIAAWKFPSAAADFLLEHRITGRMFNTYHQGGYLIWRLWPQLKVFIDGRALNEGVFNDASRIAFNADNTGGKSGEELLKEYGIDIIVMDGFEWGAGLAYYLPAALSEPGQKEWKLVFRDQHDVIFMRNPPPGLPVLESIEALAAMEAQCALYVDRNRPQCIKGMIDVFNRVGDRARLNKWIEISRLHPAQSSFVIAQ